MSGKRKCLEIMITAGVGAAMLTSIIENTKEAYKIGKEIAPRIQQYTGIGTGSIEYGLPSLACLGTIVLGAIAVIATAKYSKNLWPDIV